jgi:hypothetical protein
MGQNGQSGPKRPKILIFGPKMKQRLKSLLIIRNAPDLVYVHDFAQFFGLGAKNGHFWTFFIVKLISLFGTFNVA